MTIKNGNIYNVNYLVSTHLSKFSGYQSKKGKEGYIKSYISNIWDITTEWTIRLNKTHFQSFVDFLCYIIIHERYCLERAFQKIRIKGGMCNPCCISNLTDSTFEYLFGIIFEEYKS